MNNIDKKKLLYLPNIMPISDILLSNKSNIKSPNNKENKNALRTDISSKKIKHSENRKPIFSSPKIRVLYYIKCLRKNEIGTIMTEKLPKLEPKSMDFTRIKNQEYLTLHIDKHTSPAHYMCSPIKIIRKKNVDTLKDFYLDVDKINNVHSNYVKDLKFEVFAKYKVNKYNNLK
jgi:hypothetical protein